MTDLIKTYTNVGKWYEIDGKQELWEDIDFSDPSQFCRFGSAEEYYKKSIEHILDSYPYDGSWKQKNDWYSGLYFLDRYLYKNVLPKTTGHAQFSANGWGARAAVAGGIGEPVNKEYIKFYGGPHNPNNDFDTSNKVDSTKYRGSNLSFGDKNTIEFFMKRGNNDYVNTTTEECILDIWNNVAYTEADYYRLEILVQMVNFGFGDIKYYICIRIKNSAGTTQLRYETNNVIDGNWHFYSFTLENDGSGNFDFKIYIDSVLVSVSSAAFLAGFTSEVTQNLTGYIGAFQAPYDVITSALNPGFGKLEASLDEIRFFKTIRTKEQIQDYFRGPIYGGTNDDEENNGLGFYFKFNEGVFGVDEADCHVLDYSGRKTDGYWYGYVGGRLETSAFEESGACDVEEPDLIMNLEDSRVLSIYSSYIQTGASYDLNNRYNIKRTFPSALVDSVDNDDFTVFCQIIGSFFDELLLAQTNTPKKLMGRYEFSGLMDNDYNLRFLNSFGLDLDELFTSTSWKEMLLGINGSGSIEASIENVKKIIMSNLVNEAHSLLKKKGTVDGLRQTLRCFGVAEDIVKINRYSNTATINYEEIERVPKFYRKRYADFSKEDNQEAVVSNVIDVAAAGDRHYLRVCADKSFGKVAHCFYCDIIVPNEVQDDSETSIFGVMQVNADDASVVGLALDFVATIKKSATIDGAGEIKLSIPAIGYVGNTLVDAPFENFFDGARWILCLQLYSNEIKYNYFSETLSDFSAKISIFKMEDNICTLKFTDEQSGFDGGDVRNIFLNPHRFFVGAYRENIIGTVQSKGFCKVGEFRYYNKYLSDSEISRIAEEPNIIAMSDFAQENAINNIPEQDMIMFSWNFDNVSSIVADGALYKTQNILDCADGNDIGNVTTSIGESLSYRYPCVGYMIESDNIEDFFSDEYIVGYYEEVKEHVFDSTGNVGFYNYQLEKFNKNHVGSVDWYSIEKSFSDVLDTMILDYFSSKDQYYSLFMDGVQRYKDEYDVLDYVKNIYFRKIKNGYLDFDKFYNYYKWIDGAVSKFLSQFVSYKKHSSNFIIDTIEHHALERTKAPYKRVESDYGSGSSFESENIQSNELSANLYLYNTQNSVGVVNVENKVVIGGFEFGFPSGNFITDYKGNYFNQYDLVNTSGRFENNKYCCQFENFVKTYSIPDQTKPRVFFDREFSIFSYNYCYSNYANEAARGKNKNVFVNRFNSPGEVMTSPGRCDVESLEKSVYNCLNFRNLSSKDTLTLQWMVG